MTDLPDDLREAVEYAVGVVLWLEKDERDDLRQDLCLHFVTKPVPDKPKSWAKRFAFNWARMRARAEDNRRRNENEAAYGIACGRRRGVYWHPSWYPPHRDAVEFAPFACQEARIMHVKAGSGSRANLVEIALAAAVDVRAAKGVPHAQRRESIEDRK